MPISSPLPQDLLPILRARFFEAMEQVDKREGGCWLWPGPPASKRVNYGRLHTHYRNFFAHRVSYELAYGPIPAGKQIDHLCRNTMCVNPAHLEAVPICVNVLRGEGHAAVNARKTHCKAGHPLPAHDKRGQRNCRICRTDSARRISQQRRRLVGLGTKLAEAVLTTLGFAHSELRDRAEQFLTAAKGGK